MAKLVLWCCIGVLLLLVVLNFQVVYYGRGVFSVRPKKEWTFRDTFVVERRRPSPPAAAAGSMPNPGGLGGGVPVSNGEEAPISLSESMERCRRNRRLLEEAVSRYDLLHPEAPMKKLDIFRLIEEGLVKEIPTCPSGGDYSLRRRAGEVRVECSVHLE